MVYIVSMLREWLRGLIGWDELIQVVRANEAKLEDNARSIDALHDRIEGHESRLGRLQRQRDLSEKPSPILDWEAEQIAFINNPENFKEVS